MNRLGWIDAPEASRAQWPELAAFAAGVRQDGLTRVLLCGMGGSSLAPAVLAHAFGGAGRRAAFDILDSTDPGAVLDAERRAPLEHTLFVIASKSGTTVETLAAYHHFARRAPPRQFVAVTDPGSPLESLAKRTGFRAVFGHPPDVGGRYAALTVVGMLPAALLGVDGAELLARARRVDEEGARRLGRAVVAAALAGRGKLVLGPPPAGAGRAGGAARGGWRGATRARASGGRGRGAPVGARRCRRGTGGPRQAGAAAAAAGRAAGRLGGAARGRKLGEGRKGRDPGGRRRRRDAGRADRHGILRRPARLGRRVLAVGIRGRGVVRTARGERVRPAGRGGGEGVRARAGGADAADAIARAAARRGPARRLCGDSRLPAAAPRRRQGARAGARGLGGRAGLCGDQRVRPALPALDGPAAQGRSQHGAVPGG